MSTGVEITAVIRLEYAIRMRRLLDCHFVLRGVVVGCGEVARQQRHVAVELGHRGVEGGVERGVAKRRMGQRGGRCNGGRGSRSRS